MTPTARAHHIHRKEISAILSLALGVFLTLCLISYDPADPALNVASSLDGVTNLGGPVGAYAADFFYTILGVSAYVVAGIFFLISGLLFLGRQVHVNIRQSLAYLLMIVAAAIILHLRFETVIVREKAISAGGFVGALIGDLTTAYLNVAGAYILAGTLFFLAFVYATRMSLIILLRWTGQLIAFAARRIWQGLVIAMGRLRRAIPKWIRAAGDRLAAWQARRAEARAQAPRPAKVMLPGKEWATRPETTTGPPAHPKAAVAVTAATNPAPASADEERDDGDADESDVAEGNAVATGPRIFERQDIGRPKRPTQLELTRISANYVFPSLGFLDAKDDHVKIDEASLRHNAQTLEKKLVEYDIQGRVSEIHPGPVITMYEFEPAAGVKVNKIVNAADDLSVSLGGRSVRVVAHLPGKAAVGVEIPNSERETVYVREIIADPKFRRHKSPLPLALGKNTEGHPVVADLTKMPHLLVAGATGAGKSVAINAMICSILYKSSPADVRMILIDPKMLELSIYDGIPHLLLPVVTKPREANLALRWAVREMERRYKLLSAAQVRNIAGFNDQVAIGAITCVPEEVAEARLLADPEDIAPTGKLPHICIIIDEMADLMMVAAREIEETVIRLAQMARASGIHLILATQRPSVDIITGLIKANFPSRIAFKVSSKHDSRVIIDAIGAEHLLGAGDMLFMGPSLDGLVRLHGALVTETEIQRVVTHIKQQAKPQYDTTILQPPLDATLEIAEGDYDELYDKAVAMVTETGQASISMVQRRLRIGYNRAARLIEKMEAEGIVGPADGSKPREILVQAR